MKDYGRTQRLAHAASFKGLPQAETGLVHKPSMVHTLKTC